MDYETLNNLLTRKGDWLFSKIAATRPQEIIIIALLIIAIGIGIAILIQLKKLKDKP